MLSYQHRLNPAGQTSASRPMFQPASRSDAGRVEIRISFDTIDPPAGQLRMLAGPDTSEVPVAGMARPPARRSGSAVGGPGCGNGPAAGQEVRFCGWLGLLRALYEVTGSLASDAPDRP